MSFSPAIRSKITTLVINTGAWKGRRFGRLCEVRLERDEPVGHQFKWGLWQDKEWIRGESPTVFSALMAIERARFG